MTDSAPALFVALEASGVGAAIRQSRWLYMTANVCHIVSLAVFAGAIAVLDSRMAGALRATAPGDVLRVARRFVLAGVAGLVLSGSVLFIAEASHVAINTIFQIKMALIVLGLLNVGYFEFAVAPIVRGIPPLQPLPPAARFAGLASLTIWLCVAVCGRLIAYF